MTNTTQMVKGSLSQIAKETGRTLAESWISVDAVILVDISASMDDRDTSDGSSRYAVAQRELTKLQETLPGKIAIVAFSEEFTFVPTGLLPPTQSITDLGGALNFTHIADSIPDMRFVVISDGEPTDEDKALRAAKKYKNKIDTIYVGTEDGSGRDFLKKLAAQAGGEFMLKPKLNLLAEGIHGLLEAANE
jgi:Mg-chelatase subunit ChlD